MKRLVPGHRYPQPHTTGSLNVDKRGSEDSLTTVQHGSAHGHSHLLAHRVEPEEGAYDSNWNGATMLYAQVLVGMEVECDATSSPLVLEEEGLRGSNVRTTTAMRVLPQGQGTAVLHQHGHDGHFLAGCEGER